MNKIITVPDVLNYFAHSDFSEGESSGSSVEEIVTTHKGKPPSFTDLMLHILASNYKMDKITLDGNEGSYTPPCAYYDNVWYPFDVFL